MYKPNWLFALPDGGQWSIATILSIWYLNHFWSLSSNKLLLTSIDCKIEWIKDPVECDFCVFYDHELIIGEAKNLTELKKKDIDNLTILWKKLKTKPILCFSTLKDEFSAKEQRLLKWVISLWFLILPLTRLDMDHYDSYERFEHSKHPYPVNIRELAENLYSLNLYINNSSYASMKRMEIWPIL